MSIVPSFSQKISQLLTYLYLNPSRLEEKCPDMKKRLDSLCGNGQGLGNKCSDQEACFATVAEEFGWTQTVTSTPTSMFSYRYQANGTQKAVDFQLQTSESDTVKNIDLKHGGENGRIFLNDGTFIPGQIYIISFTKLLDKIKGERKCQRQHVCTIALGEHIMSDKDRLVLEKYNELLKVINDQPRDVDFLMLRARSANQYLCKQFTDEFNEATFNAVLASL